MSEDGMMMADFGAGWGIEYGATWFHSVDTIALANGSICALEHMNMTKMIQSRYPSLPMLSSDVPKCGSVLQIVGRSVAEREPYYCRSDIMSHIKCPKSKACMDRSFF